MRGFGFSLSSLLVFTVSVSLLASVSAGTTKEHKKKLLEKLRAALNASDTDAAVAVVASVEELDKDSAPEKNSTQETFVSVSESDVSAGISTVVKDEESTTTEVTVQSTNNYIAQFRAIMKRVLSMLGFRKEKLKDKEGRTNRMLDFENNDVDHVPIYGNEVRTTVGAVMGQKECIQKVACGAGSYLKYVKGKQLIFALLESFSPTTWKETVKVVKQSAIFDEKCDYKCLEDELA